MCLDPLVRRADLRADPPRALRGDERLRAFLRGDERLRAARAVRGPSPRDSAGGRVNGGAPPRHERRGQGTSGCVVYPAPRVERPLARPRGEPRDFVEASPYER